jgi:hypothetical protein
LFWYMTVSPCSEFAPSLSGAPLSERPMLPSAAALHLRRVRRNLFGVVSEQDLEENRNPQGGAAEAEEQAAAGRMKSAEGVPEQGRAAKRQTPSRAKFSSASMGRKPAAIAAPFDPPRTPQE